MKGSFVAPAIFPSIGDPAAALLPHGFGGRSNPVAAFP